MAQNEKPSPKGFPLERTMPFQPLVLIVGPTGRTAQTVFDAILNTDAFRTAALVRPSSQSKPAVETLRMKGVEIRLGDFIQDSVETLQTCLNGVDILISLVAAVVVPEQKNILIAAKKAEVGRIIPCDFGTVCPPGRRHLHDQKLAIRSFVRELGVTYTFIDVSWWMQLMFPNPVEAQSLGLAELSRERYADGNVKTAGLSFDDIGRFVARIIADPRTVNQYVFCWGEEVTQNEVYSVVDRVSGQKLSDLVVPVTAEEVFQRAAEAKAQYLETHQELEYARWCYNEYVNSMYLCGDNTLEKAKAAGALDARLLYPDMKLQSLEQCAHQYYKKVPDYLTL